MRSGKYSGTTETTKNMILDSAIVVINYGEVGERKLGATRGGASFKVEQEVKTIEVDGARGPVKGNRRIVSVSPSISAELLEINKENLLLAFPGATSSLSDKNGNAGSTHNKITRNLTMDDSNYFKNIALIGTVSGSGEDVICIIKNAIADGAFELSTSDNDEATTALNFVGHFDPADLNNDNFVEPWEIRYPVAEPVPTEIDILAIAGVTAPVKGATPVTTVAVNAQYTGTVAWSGAPVTFAASTVYIATITLTAKAGFTLVGVDANAFTVAGATLVKNNAGSGVVTAVFPATAV